MKSQWAQVFLRNKFQLAVAQVQSPGIKMSSVVVEANEALRIDLQK